MQPAGMSSAATALAANPVGGLATWRSSDCPHRSRPGSTSQAPSSGRNSSSAAAACKVTQVTS
eukprot:15451908-Alexandrium_andersonii.AAC.1